MPINSGQGNSDVHSTRLTTENTAPPKAQGGAQAMCMYLVFSDEFDQLHRATQYMLLA